MEGRDGSDRQRDAVATFGRPAGPHLLHCRTSHNGRGYAADACRHRGRRGRHSGRRVCRLLRYRDGEVQRPTLLGEVVLIFVSIVQRTEADLRALLAAAGFSLTRIIPTEADSLIECRPA